MPWKHALPSANSQGKVFNKSLFFIYALGTFLLIISLFILIEDQYRNLYIKKLSWKYHYLSTTTKNYDVIVLGTSRLDNGIDTGHLNRKSAQNSNSLSFFNAGLPGMNAGEFKLFLKVIKKNPHLKPKYILYHPILALPTHEGDTIRRRWSNRMSTLDINLLHLHTLKTTSRDYSFFIKNFLLSTFRVGAFNAWIFDDKPEKSRDDEKKMCQNSGFISMDEEYASDQPERRQRFLRLIPAWEKAVKKSEKKVALFKRKQRKKSLDPDKLAYHKRLIELIQETGAIPIAIFPPLVTYYQEEIALYHTLLPANHIYDINFLDYPLFNNANLWHDKGHFNQIGAIVFSDFIDDKLHQERLK